MATTEGRDPEDRLRPAPAERFSGSSHLFDLNAALRDLRAEDHPARDGHRQKTLHHRPPVARVLFSFESGGILREHSARGLVVIHVLEGVFRVGAESEDHELTAGHLLILNPEVRHDVRAVEAGAFLLTVTLDPAGA